MPKVKAFSLEKDLFPNLLKENLYGHLVDSKIYDIGTREGYQMACISL